MPGPIGKQIEDRRDRDEQPTDLIYHYRVDRPPPDGALYLPRFERIVDQNRACLHDCLGIATSLTLVSSADQRKIRGTVLEIPPPSGFAEISDVSKLPGISEASREQYRRFLTAEAPRAFALSPSGNAWAWFATLVPDAAWRALVGCSESAKEQCQLYAVDDAAVWTAPVK